MYIKRMVASFGCNNKIHFMSNMEWKTCITFSMIYHKSLVLRIYYLCI